MDAACSLAVANLSNHMKRIVMPDFIKTWLTNAVMGSWKTSLAGFIGGVCIIVIPSLQANQWPTLTQWVLACALTFVSMQAKDHDKAGVWTVNDPIRGPNSPPAQADPNKGFVFPSHTGDNR